MLKHTLKGVILYELLTITESSMWEENILSVRKGQFPPNQGLKQYEKELITELTAPTASDRPSEVWEIIDAAERISDFFQGTSDSD